MMKTTVIDTKLGMSYVFTSKTDAAKFIGVSYESIRRWKAISHIKYHNEFILCFNTELIKAESKIRPGFCRR